jgi:hypothetical protein
MCNKHLHRTYRHGDPHHEARIIGDDAARFWSKVDKNGPLPTLAPDLGPCWLWTAHRDRHGYGRFDYEGRHGYAHRFSYRLSCGTLPTDHYREELDHLCRVPACVRPTHLQWVTRRANTMRGTSATAQHARKTHCPKGHPYDFTDTAGRRRCRTCRREQARRWQRANLSS